MKINDIYSKMFWWDIILVVELVYGKFGLLVYGLYKFNFFVELFV